MHPRQRRETLIPVRPRLTVSTRRLQVRVGREIRLLASRERQRPEDAPPVADAPGSPGQFRWPRLPGPGSPARITPASRVPRPPEGSSVIRLFLILAAV